MFDPLRRSDPDVFEFDWTNFVVPQWQPGTQYVTGAIVRPIAPNGFWAQCATPNQTHAREPAWAKINGASVRDGSVVWTMVEPASITLPTISSVTYDIEPGGITQADPANAIDGMVTRIRLDAVAADLGAYRIIAEVIVDGEDYSQEQALEVVD